MVCDSETAVSLSLSLSLSLASRRIERADFVKLAMLLGGDYANGVKGVGIVNAMEVLRAFRAGDEEPDARQRHEAPELLEAREVLAAFKVWLDKGPLKRRDDADEPAPIKAFARRHATARPQSGAFQSLLFEVEGDHRKGSRTRVISALVGHK